MAEPQVIAPGSEKAVQSPSKEIKVTVETVDGANEVHVSATQRKPTYRPFPHRTIPLLVLLLLTMSLIGALEAAVHVLPSARFRGPGAVDSTPKSSGSSGQSGISSSMDTSSMVSQRRRQDDPDVVTSDTTPAVDTPTPITATNGDIASPTTPATTGEVASPTTPTPSITSASPAITASPTDNTTTLPAAATTKIEYPAYPAPNNYNNPGGESYTATVPIGFTIVQGEAAYLVAKPTSGIVTAGVNDDGIPGNGAAFFSGNGSKPKLPPLMSTTPPALIEKTYNFFLGQYAPVLVAVLLRILVTPLHRCTKLIDPFDQLRNPDGASFRDFFLAHHLGSETIRAPYQAYQRRRWNLFWSASLYAAVQAITPLASELMQIRNTIYANKLHDNVYSFVLGPSLWIDSVVVRVIQGLLALVCIQLIVVWFRIRKSEPALNANPASIATIASMMGHPQTARDFSRIDQSGELRITMGRFRDRKYRLETYTARDGSERYGLVPKGGKIRAPPPPKKEEESGTPPAHSKKDKWAFATTWMKRGGKGAKKSTKPRSIVRQDVQNLTILTAAAATLFGLVLAYFLTHTETAFERFMDSQQFGPRFMLSVLAMFLKSPLRCLWLSVTAALPWQRLAAGRARGAGASVRDVIEPVPVAITPLGGLWYALRRGEWFAAGLSLAAGLAIEVLIVLLPGVPYDSKQLFLGAKISWIGSLACLSLILLVTILGWLRMALPQGRPAWPRPPVTVGAVAMYVAGSAMAGDFAADPTTVPPPATKLAFREQEGRWMVDYVNDAVE